MRIDIKHHHHEDDDVLSGKNGESLKPTVAYDLAEAARVVNLCHAILKVDFQSQIHSYAKLFPAAWIQRAIEDAGTWPRPPATFQPILNKLRAWAKAGGPPEDAAIPAKNGHAKGPKITRADPDEMEDYE